jgi:putative ABC transport system permease protein
MSYAGLVWAALRRRPTRTVLTALSVAAAFVVLGALLGFNAGVSALLDSQQATVLRVVSRVAGGAPLPVAYTQRIQTVRGVASAASAVLVFGRYQRPRNVIPVLGTDMKALFTIYPRFAVPAAQLAAAASMPTAALVARELAQQQHWKVGDRIALRTATGDLELDVAGIYIPDDPELATWIIANYDYINASRPRDKDTVMGILASVDDIARAPEISQAIDSLFENSLYPTLTETERQYRVSQINRIGDIGLVVNAIVAAVLFTLLFLTANSLAQSVRERMGELAVLKALGFPNAALQAMVLTEALAVCATAGIAGLGIAALLLPALTSNFPTLGLRSLHLMHGAFLECIGLSLIVALASGVPLARKASHADVAKTLSG